jgi:hypothetical protein
MAVAGREDYSVLVSHDDPKDIDAGGTIQLEPGDALNQVQLVDAPHPPTVSKPPGSRKTPPPLPPTASVPPSVAPVVPATGPVAAPPADAAKRVTGKTIALFVVLVAVCAALGMGVGNWARGRQTPAPMPAASGNGVMVLPPVEMQSPDPAASPSN